MFFLLPLSCQYRIGVRIQKMKPVLYLGRASARQRAEGPDWLASPVSHGFVIQIGVNSCLCMLLIA